ncbi:MAG: hypothetical protein GX136_02305 [Clostridiales bacterium]|nr:hypothetical protein [Clostridiales bacterium]
MTGGPGLCFSLPESAEKGVIPVYEECESQLAVRAGIARRAVTIFPYGSPTTSG